MTTNSPEIACWGSFCEGVMQDFGYNEEAAKSSAKLDFHGRELSVEPLVRLSDYESLQAECEKLRSLLAEIEGECSQRDMPSEQAIARWVEAIDAAMETTK